MKRLAHRMANVQLYALTVLSIIENPLTEARRVFK